MTFDVMTFGDLESFPAGVGSFSRNQEKSRFCPELLWTICLGRLYTRICASTKRRTVSRRCTASEQQSIPAARTPVGARFAFARACKGILLAHSKSIVQFLIC